MPRYILSVDQGTTGTTAALMDQRGVVVSKNSKEYPQIYPQPGWVEHSPEEIWNSVVETISETMKKVGVNPVEVAAIGITNQRETVVVWDRSTGKPIYNAIVWQCRRTTDLCEKLKKAGKEKMVRKKTGLVLDPYFSATKIKWILDHVKGAKKKAQKGELAAGTIDAFLIWRLTGGRVHATDVSNASRTMLMNIDKGDWDADLLKLFTVPRSLLPEIRPSSGEFGKTKNLSFLPDGIPVAGVAGDQQAALFGQVCFDVGDAKCTFGTGSFLLMNTGSKRVVSKSGILTTVAWQLGSGGELTYALEGGAFICGAAVQWLRDGMKIISTSSEIENLAGEVSDAGGVEFVPALVGLGAPYWDPSARGLICGLTRGSTRAHLARATLDAMALQNLDILLAMQKDLGRKLKSLRVDGGATTNNLLMQLQSDYLGQKIYRPQMIESTVGGAAFLAGLGVGFWRDLKELRRVWKLDREFAPAISPSVRQKRVKSWHEAIARARA